MEKDKETKVEVEEKQDVVQENQQQQETEASEEPIAQQEEEVQQRLAQLDSQVADLKDKNLRMMAEFDNYRRRTSKEKLDLKENVQDEMLREFLPLVDDFDRAMIAMEQAANVEALREGVKLIYDKVADYLDKYGVKQIETDGVPFDVDFHEAIAMFPAPTDDLKGKVMDCVKKGYTRNDKVLRHAQVAVGQ